MEPVPAPAPVAAPEPPAQQHDRDLGDVGQRARGDRQREESWRYTLSTIDRGSWPEALEHARRRVQVEPLSEPAHADLIRVSAWSGDTGNFWGHNAIIRMTAFAGACGLPRLPGKPPML